MLNMTLGCHITRAKLYREMEPRLFAGTARPPSRETLRLSPLLADGGTTRGKVCRKMKRRLIFG